METKKQLSDAKGFFTKKKEEKIQNSLPTEAPDWAVRPFFYMDGIQKSVKIADVVFNYIDYLEAIGFECNTHAPRYVKERNFKRVKEALKKANHKH